MQAPDTVMFADFPPTPARSTDPYTIVIARGDRIRHFRLRPWVAGICATVLAALAVSYLLATSYLIFRDDIMSAASLRQARLQQAYEDRISALRAQVDQLTSRQMLDRQLMETRVGELLARQAYLTELHGRLDRTFRKAASTLPTAKKMAQPEPGPELRAGLDGTGLDADASNGLAFAGTVAPTDTIFASLLSSGTAVGDETTADRTGRLAADIDRSLHIIEHQQIDRIDEIAQDAYRAADAIAGALADAGLRVETGDDRTGIGGPFVAIGDSATFGEKVRELDEALNLVERMKSEARSVPIADPSPGHAVSSRFGVRKDPLLGTPAMHSGLDFRAPAGSAILATASGTVVSAGWNGGYGRMVEVRHADGFSTRYAHMGSILVEEGQQIAAGDVIGKSGSSGRSTGPHLHYEVHRHGKPLDPARFLKAGRKIGDYL